MEDDNDDFLPEYDLNPIRRERENKSKAAFSKDGGKAIDISKAVNHPNF